MRGGFGGAIIRDMVTIERTQMERVRALCERHHIRRLALFGSALTDSLRPESDIDLLVEFEPGHVPGFFRLFEMEADFSEEFGRKVDLRTAHDLSRHFRDEVVREAQPLYAKE